MKTAFKFKSGTGQIIAFFILAIVFSSIAGVVFLVINQNPAKSPQAAGYTVENLIADMSGNNDGSFCEPPASYDWGRKGDGLPSTNEAPSTARLTGWGTAQWTTCGGSVSGARIQLQNFHMYGLIGSSWVAYGGQIGEWCANLDPDTYSNMTSCSNSGTAASPNWAMPTGRRAIHWGTYHQTVKSGTQCMVVYYEAKSVGAPLVFNVGADNATLEGGIQGRQFVSRYKLINTSTWTPMAGSNCSATTLRNNPPPGLGTTQPSVAPSTAPSPQPTQQPVLSGMIEAESMTINSGYVNSSGNIFSDSSASGGKGLSLLSNGNASGTINSGFNTIKVKAKSDICSGPARMIVKIDGAVAMTQLVAESGWTEYTTGGLNKTAGNHTITVEFTNDYNPGTCDRNLRIDKVSVETAAAGPNRCDVSGDGKLTSADTNLLGANYGSVTASTSKYDLNKDGTVNSNDQGILAQGISKYPATTQYCY